MIFAGHLIVFINLIMMADGESSSLRGQTCAARHSCQDCLAEGSGCYGWQGSKCCQQDECSTAGVTEVMTYTSCAVWLKDEELSKKCSMVERNDTCACVAAGCVSQELSAGNMACLPKKRSGGHALHCHTVAPSSSVVVLQESVAMANSRITEWAGSLNDAIDSPSIGLAVGASSSILGGLLAGDGLTPNDLLTLATNWVPAITGLVHPGVGLGLTFAFSLISGLMQTQQPDPIQVMYRRIMSEVDMKIDTGFFKYMIGQAQVELQEAAIQMSRLPDYEDKHTPSDTYGAYREVRNNLEKVISKLIHGQNQFPPHDFGVQKYRASVLPLVIACFNMIFTASSEMIRVRPAVKEPVTNEIKERLKQWQPFLQEALDDSWIVRRHFIFALQWVDHQPGHIDRERQGHEWRQCFVKGTPSCIDGFLGVDVCAQRTCEVERQPYIVQGRGSCRRTASSPCGVVHHQHLMRAAEKAVRLQQDTVDAILNITNEDYNFPDSICKTMRFSLSEENFYNATRSFTNRVMKCYIRRAATQIRPRDLNTLEKWRPNVLKMLSQKYLGKDLTLDHLISDINEVQPSAAPTPRTPLPDPGECKRSTTVYSEKGRMREFHGLSEDQCKQKCEDQAGCHCVEHYPNGGCVLVSKGAPKYGAPWYWLSKPNTIRLERCEGSLSTC